MLVALAIVTVRAADVPANATLTPTVEPVPVPSTTGLHVKLPESVIVAVVVFECSYRTSSRLFAGAVNDAVTQFPVATRAMAGVAALIAIATAYPLRIAEAAHVAVKLIAAAATVIDAAVTELPSAAPTP